MLRFEVISEIRLQRQSDQQVDDLFRHVRVNQASIHHVMAQLQVVMVSRGFIAVIQTDK